MIQRPTRKSLPHLVPNWVPDGSVYFITLNALPRGEDPLLPHAPALWDSILFNTDRGLWWPHLLVVMPDHLHGLFGFSREAAIQKAVTDWKHFNGHTFGITWQRDFFEHRLRGDESFDEKAFYIRMNPVRRGLCAKPEEWPYTWSLAASGPRRSAGPTS